MYRSWQWVSNCRRCKREWSTAVLQGVRHIMWWRIKINGKTVREQARSSTSEPLSLLACTKCLFFCSLSIWFNTLTNIFKSFILSLSQSYVVVYQFFWHQTKGALSSLSRGELRHKRSLLLENEDGTQSDMLFHPWPCAHSPISARIVHCLTWLNNGTVL